MADRPKRKRRRLQATLSVTGMPELLAHLRTDLAKLLREVADDEPPEVARRLREIADLFETGLSEEP
jgi:hypothetical protein